MFDRLILDAGGVLISDAMPEVFEDLAIVAGVAPTVDTLLECHATMSQLLWCGEIPEMAYWEALADVLGVEVDDSWRDLLSARLRPLIPARAIATWHREVELVLLSNHRTEWLKPALFKAGYLEHFDRLIISDSVGFAKPHHRIFELATPAAGRRTLFVDDREFNLDVGREFGWETIVGDPDGRWVAEVFARLGIECGSR